MCQYLMVLCDVIFWLFAKRIICLRRSFFTTFSYRVQFLFCCVVENLNSQFCLEPFSGDDSSVYGGCAVLRDSTLLQLSAVWCCRTTSGEWALFYIIYKFIIQFSKVNILICFALYFLQYYVYNLFIFRLPFISFCCNFC